MRHFWFSDDDGENIIADHRGNIRGARTKAEKYMAEHPDCETVYINENDDIVECIFRELE